VPAGAQAPAPPAGGAPNGAVNGEQIFAAMCGFCHLGGGRSAGKGPKLAGTDKSDSYLLNRIKNGKPGEMPAFGRAFTEEQIRALLAYIRTLKELP
jgi:mono/diheme cytochrome c family protein